METASRASRWTDFPRYLRSVLRGNPVRRQIMPIPITVPVGKSTEGGSFLCFQGEFHFSANMLPIQQRQRPHEIV